MDEWNIYGHVLQCISLLESLAKRIDSFIEATEQSHRLMLSLMGWEPPPEPVTTPIAVLELPPRVSNVLIRYGFGTVEDVLAATPKQLLALRNFGRGALASLEAELESKGYSREAKP
jgi:DNA-directed RNA polymerase alpha subunit